MFEKREKNNQYDGGNFTVRLRKEESVESLIKRHLKKLKKDRLIEEILERKHFKKPTTKRREAKFRRILVLERMKRKEMLELEMDD